MPPSKSFNETEVLEKAMRLFWEQGYHATSIRDLVGHLGINRASLYATFGGKKQLFSQALALYCSQNRHATQAFLADQVSVKDGIRTLFRNAVDTATLDTCRRGCFVVNATTELMPQDDVIKKVLQEHKAGYQNMFYKFLLKGEETGEIIANKDLKAISHLIYTLLSGINVVSKIETNDKDILASANTALMLLD